MQKKHLTQNDSYENQGTFSNKNFDIIQRFFSVQFILPNVEDCQLKYNFIISTDSTEIFLKSSEYDQEIP